MEPGQGKAQCTSPLLTKSEFSESSAFIFVSVHSTTRLGTAQSNAMACIQCTRRCTHLSSRSEWEFPFFFVSQCCPLNTPFHGSKRSLRNHLMKCAVSCLPRTAKGTTHFHSSSSIPPSGEYDWCFLFICLRMYLIVLLAMTLCWGGREHVENRLEMPNAAKAQTFETTNYTL